MMMSVSKDRKTADNWIDHIKVLDHLIDSDLNHIREMYLEKAEKRGIVNATIEALRYHA